MRYDGALIRHAGPADPDHAALLAAREPGVALCTIVNIDGSFSRRCGAQIAVLPDGSVIGDLADTCLEQELAAAAARAPGPLTLRYGKGSSMIDFRLPCGGGLDILIDPFPDRAAVLRAIGNLADRRPASLVLAANPQLAARRYVPSLQIAAFGEGPELDWLVKIGTASGISIEAMDKRHLSLGRPPGHVMLDRWTAVALLFHDHEWETPLLAHALSSDAFFIGAQGGARAREHRLHNLQREGFGAGQLARIKSPVGATSGSRTPQALALAVLSDIVSHYEKLHPHG